MTYMQTPAGTDQPGWEAFTAKARVWDAWYRVAGLTGVGIVNAAIDRLGAPEGKFNPLCKDCVGKKHAQTGL
jgi:hypothetical protein